MSKTINLDIPASWQFVRQIKRIVEDALRDHPEAIRYSAAMVASELAGNAIKYGDRSDGAPPARISIVLTDTQVEIEVSNRVKSPSHLEQVQLRLGQMSSSPSKEEFYLNRLQELLTGSAQTSGSQLGLYRIGYEGEFDLSCTTADQDLTIRATRGLS